MRKMTRTRSVILALFLFAASFGFICRSSRPGSQQRASTEASNGLEQLQHASVQREFRMITAAQIKAQSDAMHANLQSHGYTYINVDAGWNNGLDGYARRIQHHAVPQWHYRCH